jgi:hypothetical protein
MRARSRTQFAVGALSSQGPRIVFLVEIFQTERADGRHQRDVRISANESGKRKSSARARPASPPSTGYMAFPNLAVTTTRSLRCLIDRYNPANAISS